MSVAERVLLLSSDYYNMKDESTSREISGHSVWFVNQYREQGADSKGFKPSKVSITNEVAEQLNKANLPAVAELQYGSRPGAGGKATLTVTGFKIVGSVNFDKLFATPVTA